MIVALAGRRIDAPGAHPPRFPLENAGLVSERLGELLRSIRPGLLVSSAACGADLLALATAGELHIRRRVVLPFERRRFRATSVTDRPGDWGADFDEILDEVTARSDLVVLDGTESTEAYSRANLRILAEALSFAGSPGGALAVLVWEGASRGPDDLTAAFGDEAIARGLRTAEIRTV